MIRRTFLFLEGVGARTEARLRADGICDWEGFLEADRLRGISKERKVQLDAQIREAVRCLEAHEYGFFSRHLPTPELWRLYGPLREDAVFLDIETTGLSREEDDITVVGTYGRRGLESFIRGENLDGDVLKEAMEGCGMLVTFSGSVFDVPFLKARFPGLEFDMPHLDLRYPLRRLGFGGGLKRIERRLGIERDEETKDIRGEDAIYLWYLWEEKGDRGALEKLVKYNGEDVRNLEFLADYLYSRMSGQGQ